jgi:FkbM family methyltransferase
MANEHIYPLCANSSELFDEVVRRDTRLAFDIGANIGGFSFTLSEKFQKVIAFEPLPEQFQMAMETCKNKNNIVFENIGLSDRSGSLLINVYHAWTLLPSAKVIEHDRALDYINHNDVEVKFETLDAMVIKHGVPSFIKLDVDGYELKVINGGKEFFNNNRPPVHMELSALSAKVGDAAEAPLKAMYDLGYKAHSLDGRYVAETYEKAMLHFPYHTSYDVIMLL